MYIYKMNFTSLTFGLSSREKVGGLDFSIQLILKFYLLGFVNKSTFKPT